MVLLGCDLVFQSHRQVLLFLKTCSLHLQSRSSSKHKHSLKLIKKWFFSDLTCTCVYSMGQLYCGQFMLPVPWDHRIFVADLGTKQWPTFKNLIWLQDESYLETRDQCQILGSQLRKTWTVRTIPGNSSIFHFLGT